MATKVWSHRHSLERVDGAPVNAKRVIPVAAPVLAGNEKNYVMDCLESGWISSSGKYVERFEAAFADLCQAEHAISCCNGTVALHLALLALGVEPEDEVIIPTLTYVATANAVTYCGAQPVLVDSEPDTWNIDPLLIETKITSRTKGIIVVHLYGHPVDMDPVISIARKYGLFVIEDAAEAHGATYKGSMAGSLADIATFSFYGNKVMTTGEGGMVVTSDGALASRVRLLKGQGMDPKQRYWFPIVGYNYRLTNVAAAIGLGQVEMAEWHLQRRQEVAAWYREELKGISGLTWQLEKEWARHASWMFTVLFEEALPCSRDDIAAHLQECGIETRPVFYPMHVLPPYQHLGDANDFPIANRISARGMNLPTWAGLTREDIRYVSEILLESLDKTCRR